MRLGSNTEDKDLCNRDNRAQHEDGKHNGNMSMTQKVIVLELVKRMYCLLVCSTFSFNHVPYTTYTHNTYMHTHSHTHTQRVQTPRGRVWCTGGSWGSHVLCVFICDLLFTLVKYTEQYLNSIHFLSIVEFMHFTVDFQHLRYGGRGCMRSKLSLILLSPLMENTLARSVIIREANNTLCTMPDS